MNLRLNEACKTRTASRRKAPIAKAITAFRRPEVFVSSRVGLGKTKAKRPGGTESRRRNRLHYRAAAAGQWPMPRLHNRADRFSVARDATKAVSAAQQRVARRRS